MSHIHFDYIGTRGNGDSKVGDQLRSRSTKNAKMREGRKLNNQLLFLRHDRQERAVRMGATKIKECCIREGGEGAETEDLKARRTFLETDIFGKG